MRRAAKVDANQSAIVAALRGLGALVEPMHAVGGGFPDLLVMHRGRTFLVEVKDGGKPPSARKLTPDQVTWHAAAESRGIPVHIVKSEAEAIELLRGANDPV